MLCSYANINLANSSNTYAYYTYMRYGYKHNAAAAFYAFSIVAATRTFLASKAFTVYMLSFRIVILSLTL